MNRQGDNQDPDPEGVERYHASTFGGEETEPGIDLTDPTLPPAAHDRVARDDDEEAYLPRLENDATRYTGFLRLGKGGSGLVQSCRDPHLGRVVAIKTLHPHMGASTFHRSRFIQEARIMAQLEHPNVVPVHELGVDEKAASVYFTMKRVQGATLLQVLKALKEDDGGFTETFSPSRLLDVFVQVCQAVAFAHSKGVVHRDLKPDNILLGSFGEVLVMDWGLAKVKGGAGEAGSLDLSDIKDGETTLPGTVSGTPLNMSPEQAMGDVAAVDERSDVFSLGGLLYHMLTLERPFGGKDVMEILHNVIHAQPRPPQRRTPGRDIPRELDAICMKALEKRKEDRFQSLADLINELQRYRDGRPVRCCPDSPWRRGWKWCRRHPVASSAVATGLAVLLLGATTTQLAGFLKYRHLMGEGDRHREAGLVLLEEQATVWDDLQALEAANLSKIPTEDQRRLQERLDRLADESADHFEDALMLYLLAANDRPTPRRRAAVLDMLLPRVAWARRAGQYDQVERLLNLPRVSFGEGYEDLEEETREVLLDAERYVRGEGRLALTSDPPGARASLVTLTNRSGRFVPEGPPRDLGPTPLEALALPKGRYVITLEARDRPRVVFPVWVEHAEDETASVFLPREVPTGMVYVAGGPFYAGGKAARSHRRHRVTLPGYFIRSTEVTFGEYLAYWRAEDGAARAPADMPRVRLEREERRYHNAWDPQGNLLPPFETDHPVVGITQASASRYCAWREKKLGHACRLPTSYEWEKAARGADAREFVWGNGFDPAFALVFETPPDHRPQGLFAPPGSFPHDRSIYGAFDLGGNAREWTSTPFRPADRGLYEVKGGSASTTRRFLYSAYASDTPVVPTDIGFRYVYPFDPDLDGAPAATSP